MANGKNPLNYSDFFDITDDRVINSLINRIKEVNKEYGKLAKSVESLAKAQTDSLTRSTKELIDAIKGLSTASEQDKKAMLSLSQAVEELKKRQEAQINTQNKSLDSLKQAQQQYDAISQNLAKLRQEYIQLQQADVQDEKAKKAVAKQIRENNALLRSLTAEYKTSRQAITGVVGSYVELEQRVKSNIAKLKQMPDALRPVSEETKQLIYDIKQGNQQLKDFDKQIGIFNRNVGNYAEGFRNASENVLGFIGSAGIGAVIGAVTLATTAIQAGIESNLELSDSLSDIQRAASLTATETDNLVVSLQKIDTRTTLKGLLDIAIIGGQLGIAKEELAGFTEAVDQLGVVLSNELSGGVEGLATGLGKINNVFKTTQKEGISVRDAMLKTGSAILYAGQSGIASGDFLVDFTQRVGTVAQRANISIPTILAYGATLEEAGISAETASSAFNNLIGLISKSPKDFLKVAKLVDDKLNLESFTKLINTDTAKALELFAKGIALGGAKMTDFAKISSKLGLSSDELSRTLGALAGNIDGLQEKTVGISKAYADGSLATEQFRLKNENLVGAIERLQNLLSENFVNSEFSRGLAQLINNLVDGRSEFENLSNEYKNQQSRLSPLLTSYDELTAKSKALGGETKLTAEEQTKLKDIIKEISSIMPDSIAKIDNYSNVIAITRGKVDELSVALMKQVEAQRLVESGQIIKQNQDLQATIELTKKQLVSSESLFEKAFGSTKANSLSVLNKATQKYAENLVRLRDVLGQRLSKEQEDFLTQIQGGKDKSQGTSTNDPATKALEDKIKQLQKELEATGKSTKATKEAKTAIEQLREQINKYSLAIENQALKGNISLETLGKYKDAVNKLSKAQTDASLVMLQAIDPMKALQEQSTVLQEELSKQIQFGQNTEKTANSLKIVNEAIIEGQNALKLAIAETVGGIELLNTKLELSRQQFEKEAVQGNISNKTFSEFQKTTDDVAEAQIKLQRATLQATDPMGLLNFEIEQLAGAMQRQVLQGGLSAETINKYADSLINLNKVQERLKDAQNPFFGQDISVLQAETALAKITPGARRQFDATGGGKQVEEARKIEQQVLQARIDRINAEQEAYDTSYKRWYELELEKTQILAQQEENRTRITKEKQDKRNRIVEESTQLLTGLLSGLTDIAKINADNELAYLEQKKNKELEITGNNSDAKAAIEKKYAKQQAEIRRRQAENEKKMALFEIAIQTAIAVSKAVASSPLTFGLPWSAFALATGALQAGLVLAKPVPAYAKGTKNAPEGLAIVGERGTEAIESKDGSVRLTQNKAHLAYLQQGDIVHTADSKETRMYKDALSGISGGSKSSNAYADAYQSINSNKRKFEDNRVTQMARQMQLSPEAIATAMQKAIRNELVIERHTFDENGYSSYRNKKGLSVKKLNSRNTFGSQG